jgi:hypothetical protein
MPQIQPAETTGDRADSATGSLGQKLHSVLDKFAVSEQPPSRHGSVVSVVLIALAIWFAVRDWQARVRRPWQQTNEVLWSTMSGIAREDGGGSPRPTFPLTLSCLAAAGCQVSVHYSGASTMSRACAAPRAGNSSDACVALRSGERLRLNLCFSDVLSDGVVVHAANATMVGMVVAVESNFLMAPATGERPVPMLGMSPLHTGRNVLRLVHTDNATLAAGDLGRTRDEFFPSWGKDVPSLQAAQRCGGPGNGTTQLAIDLQWTQVVVVPVPLFLPWAAAVGGAWGLLLEAGALVLVLGAGALSLGSCA